MEADWEVEIGPDAPVIDACWSGLVDLRSAPELAQTLPEARDLPDLADTLASLNGARSPVWTAKCDVWRVIDSSQFDPYELDADPASAACAWACYIDLLPNGDHQRVGPCVEPGVTTAWCAEICKRLRSIPLRGCRADLVVRRAIIPEATETASDIGITAYFTACGLTSDEAVVALGNALGMFADAVCGLER